MNYNNLIPFCFYRIQNESRKMPKLKFLFDIYFCLILYSTEKDHREIFKRKFAEMLFYRPWFALGMNKIKSKRKKIILYLPFVGLMPLGLHFFVICLFCSQEGSLLAFSLSFRVIWLWALHSPHVPFSYRHARTMRNKLL